MVPPVPLSYNGHCAVLHKRLVVDFGIDKGSITSMTEQLIRA